MTDDRRPVYRRVLPGPGEDQPIRITLRDYKAALENLQLEDAQMRFSRTVFDSGYASDFEEYHHFYWLAVESGVLTLSFKRGDHVVVYRKDGDEQPVADGMTVELFPGDLVVMVNIDVQVNNAWKDLTTILTCGWVNQDDPSPCFGGCWLP